ncbi:hypothetical protein HRbin37_02295 [bacterium HR37]|nr:hypothetical protein HRbin37_02295 [bacterium HR37]
MSKGAYHFTRGELEGFKSSIAWDVVLSILTCGIYNLFWQYRQIRAVNTLLGEERLSFIRWLILSVLTCGIYHIYYEYVVGREIETLQERFAVTRSGSLPTISVILAIVGLSIVADAIQQREINMLVEKALKDVG